jgi:catalase
VGGFTTSDGELLPADQKIGGGPSVLYDAVVLLPGEESVAQLVPDAAVRDFVADAFGHCKFIGHVAAAQPLLEAAGVLPRIDGGFVAVDDAGAAAFLEQCRELRFWDREALVTTAR